MGMFPGRYERDPQPLESLGYIVLSDREMEGELIWRYTRGIADVKNPIEFGLEVWKIKDYDGEAYLKSFTLFKWRAKNGKIIYTRVQYDWGSVPKSVVDTEAVVDECLQYIYYFWGLKSILSTHLMLFEKKLEELGVEIPEVLKS